MFNTIRTLGRALAGASMLGLMAMAAGPVQAETVAADADAPDCLGGYTPVCIVERASVSQPRPYVQYLVTINDGSEVSAFGVTNSKPVDEVEIRAFHPLWKGKYVSREQWDSNAYTFDFLIGGVSSLWISGDADSTDTADGTTYIGTYDSLFGADAEGQAAYWWNFRAAQPFNHGQASGLVLYDATPESNFAVQDTTGAVVVSSVTLAVPEPGAALLALTALGMVGWSRRQRRASHA